MNSTRRIKAARARIEGILAGPASAGAAQELADAKSELRYAATQGRTPFIVWLITLLAAFGGLTTAYELLVPQTYYLGTGGLPHALFLLAAFGAALWAAFAATALFRKLKLANHKDLLDAKLY